METNLFTLRASTRWLNEAKLVGAIVPTELAPSTSLFMATSGPIVKKVIKELTD